MRVFNYIAHAQTFVFFTPVRSQTAIRVGSRLFPPLLPPPPVLIPDVLSLIFFFLLALLPNE